MGGTHSKYVCQQCGFESTRWLGKCSNCGQWNSMVETVSVSGGKSKAGVSKIAAKPIALSSISSKKNSRTSTKISELDRVLGGGLVQGQVILLAGEPGIGKSTILLQVVSKLSSKKATALYISGEESVGQIKIRSERMGISGGGVELLESTDVDEIVGAVESLSNLSVIIVDSIQTMQTSDLSGMAGSVGQVRECAYRLVRLAKSNGVPIIIVGHVTKEGSVAGPAVLAHIVDTVLWFEGDKSLPIRMLHSRKNRFGPTDEVGIFEMVERGLLSLPNPEKLFLSGTEPTPGCATTCILHGTRPIVVEIQSLVVPTKTPYPKRIAQGFDPKRLEILVAILSRRCHVPLYEMDIFLNIAGGFAIKEPAADLAVALSLASSYYDKKLPKHIIALGEVSLAGDIREVPGQARRIKEASRLGYKSTITNKDFRYLAETIKRYLK